MAIVVRYFSTTGAGAEDGTTWADRAPFITGGAYNTIITAFDFNSADTLECRVGPGTYTAPATIAVGLFTVNAPRPSFPLLLHGCDSSGNRIVPDLDWNCAQGPLDTTGFPVFDMTSSYNINLANLYMRCISVTGSINGAPSNAVNGCVFDYCYFESTRTNSTQPALQNADGGIVTNSHVRMNSASTSFAAVLTGNGGLYNVRIQGISGATSGNRFGAQTVATGSRTQARGPVCVFDCPGSGIYGGQGYQVGNVTAYNCGIGIDMFGTASLAANSDRIHMATRNFIANCTTGIQNTNVSAFLTGNRIRATTPTSLYGNSYEFDNDTAAGNDTDEFVDAANGDFRIKSTSIYWGKGIGAGDEPASGGGGSKPVSPFEQKVIA